MRAGWQALFSCNAPEGESWESWVDLGESPAAPQGQQAEWARERAVGLVRQGQIISSNGIVCGYPHFQGQVRERPVADVPFHDDNLVNGAIGFLALAALFLAVRR